MSAPEPVLHAGALCGESPVWIAREGALYFTDIPACTVHRFDPASGAHRTFAAPEEVCALAPREAGGFVAALRSRFALLDLETGTAETLASPEPDRPENRLNDGRCDPAGRFWAGSMHLPRTRADGTLYRLDTDGTCTAMAGDVIVSNGLAFSPDGGTMYWSDSRSGRICAFDFDVPSGTIANRRTFFETTEAEGRPDGAAVDAEGFYWSACFRGSRILRIAPDGTLDRQILMPVRDATMLAFGGPDLATLYITTASEALTAAERTEDPLAGSLFAVDPGVHGLPERAYGG